MKCTDPTMLEFLEGSKVYFAIPVYQRRYSWKEENCRQLLSDLKKLLLSPQDSSHFFGSFVIQVNPIGHQSENSIIDGQQRLTTVFLLLLALKNLLDEGKIQSEEPFLSEKIKPFLIKQFTNEVRLFPVEKDRDAFSKLFDDESTHDPVSQLTINYQFFRNAILEESISPEGLFHAIDRLKTIVLSLEPNEHPQVIFESLNSTGLALEEGDKIRNYVLMDQSSEKQSEYYENYWTKIERFVGGDVSNFIRDFLTLKLAKAPNIKKVYRAFRDYIESNNFELEDVLKKLLRYARNYEKLLTGDSGFSSKSAKPINDSLCRLKRLEIVVARPFHMEALLLHEQGALTDDDLLRILLITESYLFRRNICVIATNALNKIFANLNEEILRYDGTTRSYVDKMIYALRSRKSGGRFPNDEEFATALAAKQIYSMRSLYKYYLFERFENYGIKETKDVVTHLECGDYTIEHIMPQRLSSEWREELGKDAQIIHDEWLNRLANLTLTAYNSKLSNKSFREKRDTPEGGYKSSGIRMNIKIASKERWGLRELKERNADMIGQALKIWFCPQTEFKPVKIAKEQYDSCTLDDDQIELTNREIVQYSYNNIVHVVNNWAEMFEQVVKMCHHADRSVLIELANAEDNRDMAQYVKTTEKALRAAFKIDEKIYFERNTSTNRKRVILRQLFELYDLDPSDLVFYLKPQDETVES